MCEICIEIYNKSENRDMEQKSRRLGGAETLLETKEYYFIGFIIYLSLFFKIIWCSDSNFHEMSYYWFISDISVWYPTESWYRHKGFTVELFLAPIAKTEIPVKSAIH